MLERDPARGFYEQVRETFGSDDLTVVVIEAPDVFTPETLGIVSRLSEALGRLEGVTRVDSLTTVDHIAADADQLEIAPLLRDGVPSDPVALARIRREATANPIFARSLVASDARAAGIVVYTQADDTDREFNQRFAGEVEALLAAESAPGIVLYQIGGPLIKATAVDYVKRDQFTLIPLSALTLFVVLFLGFRTPQGTVPPLVTGLVSIVWGLGLMAIFGVPINIITAAVPSLVLVIGFAEAVHLISAYHRQLAHGRDRQHALEEAIDEAALPITVTTATTVVAFATLILTDITMLIQFGYGATLALSANFVATLLGIPLILRLWPTPTRLRGSAFDADPDDGARNPRIERAGDFILRHRLPISAGFALLAAASVVGWTTLRVDTDFISYFPEDAPIRQRMRDAQASLSGASAFYVVVESDRENGIADPAMLRQIASLQTFLESQPGIDKTISIADYVSVLHAELSGGANDGRIIPDSPDLVAQHLLLMDRAQIARFLDLPASTANILVRHNLTGSWELSRALDEIEAYAGAHVRGATVRPTGLSVLTSRAADYMAVNELTSFLYTLLIIGAIHSALFMSVKAGFLSLVPNVIPVVYSFGLMGLLDVPLSTGTAMVATIAIGIAVDDTVHNMVTYSRQLQEHHDERLAALRTLAIQARPIAYISLALAAGFSVLAFSRFVPTVHVGLLSAFVMIVAMVAELVLAPILMSSTRLVTLWDMLLLRMNPELVRRAPLFEGLSRWEARKVVLLGMLRPLAPGEYTFRKGEQGRDLFMVVTGRMLVLDFEPDGTERTLGIVGPGGLFGETGVVGDGYRTISARADAESEVLRLDFAAFERLRRRFPYTAAKVFRNLARILSERLQDTTTALLYLSSVESGAAPRR